VELGKGAASGRGARFDGVVNAVEIVPSEGLHVGTQDEVGVTLQVSSWCFCAALTARLTT